MGSHVRQRAGCGDGGVARTIWTYEGSDKTRKGRLLRGRQRRDCRCRLVSGMGGRGWSCSGLFILAVGRPRARRPLCRDRSFPQTYRSGHPRASKVLLAATTSSVNINIKRPTTLDEGTALAASQNTETGKDPTLETLVPMALGQIYNLSGAGQQHSLYCRGPTSYMLATDHCSTSKIAEDCSAAVYVLPGRGRPCAPGLKTPLSRAGGRIPAPSVNQDRDAVSIRWEDLPPLSYCRVTPRPNG
jgi:hypothetical protein